MFHLLQLEWKKQKNFTLFRVLIIAYLVLLPGALMIGKKIPLEGAPFNPQVMFFQFPTVWDWLGYTGNWLVFFVLGFLAVLLVTNEHSYRTLRQNVITGLHRHEFFLSKIIFMLAICLGFTIYYGLAAIVIGTLHAESVSFSAMFDHWNYLPRYFLMSLGYMSFGLLVGVLVKRTGIALFVYLAYGIFLEPVIRWALHLKFMKHKSMNFYPLNAMEDLCPVPVAQMAEQFMKENDFSLYLTIPEAATATAIYVALFFFLSYKKLVTSDL